MLNSTSADPKKSHVASTWAHGAPLINCRFDPKGRYVFATAEDRAVVRWEVASGKKTEFRAHESWARGMAFSKNGETVVSTGYDDTLVWWPVAAEKPAPIRKVKAHDGWIRAAATSPDGKLLASAGNDRIVKLWSFDDGTPVREMKGHERDIYSLLFHPSGKFLLAGDLDGKVRQWDVSSGKLARTLEAKDLHTYHGGQQVHYGGVRSLSLSPDGKELACAGLHKGTNPLGAVNEPLVVRFDWASGKLTKKHPAPGVKGVAWRALFHPDGFLLGCSGGSGGGFLLFWKPGEEKPFHKVKLPDTARELDLHPDGLRVATAHYDKKLRISRMAAKGKG